MIETTRTIHGSLISVGGIGFLIVGEPGIGKTYLCLEAIGRGHKLVADDAAEIRKAGKFLIGCAPAAIRGLIEKRGIGCVDVRTEFGPDAFLSETRIHAIIELEDGNGSPMFDNFSHNAWTKKLFDVKLILLRRRSVDVVFLEEIARQIAESEINGSIGFSASAQLATFARP